MPYKKLLLDVDGTLLDFDKSAEKALETLFGQRGYPYNETIFPLYEEINVGLWERYERGEISRDRVLVDRFTIIFWMEGAEELLRELQPEYELNIVTNGVARTQKARLTATGLYAYVKDVFISEMIGAQKPQKAYFDYCLSHIGPCEKEEILLVGDSLTADILGANMAGIPSCWFNPKGKPLTGDARPDYEIRRLEELKGIL